MNTQAAVVLIFGVLVLAVFAGWLISSRRRSQGLRSRFGPEYEREVQELGSRRNAEKELGQRARRVDELSLRPLPATDRTRYAEMWNHQQSRFVEDPPGAVNAADRLVEEVMVKCGYPVAEFDQRAADISVHHPGVVENYRTAHDIATRIDRGGAVTEDLRRAMMCYRSLCEERLDDRLAHGHA